MFKTITGKRKLYMQNNSVFIDLFGNFYSQIFFNFSCVLINTCKKKNNIQHSSL